MHLLWLLSVLTLSVHVFSHRCGSDEASKRIKKTETDHYGSSKRFLASTDWSPIRIYVDYSTLNSQTSLVSSSYINNIKSIVDTTVAIYKKILMVKGLSNPLKINSCDSGTTTKTIISTDVINGVSYDLVIFPMIDSDAAATTEAWAAPCNIDSTTKRPTAGIMSFNKYMNFTRSNANSYFQLLTLHEINHILSFNADMFGNFIDSNGNVMGQNKVTTTAMVNGLNRTLIITPKVVAAAKTHYNCSSLIGVELENQGGDATAGSHWEARVMLGDFMIGESYAENVISEMSLALMEDSGWYQVNYYTAGLFRYGKNQGCDFLNTKCVINNVVAFSNEYSTQIGATMCTAGRQSKGLSSLATGRKISVASYQYWKDTTEGGYLMADYCPVAYANVIDDTTYFATSCNYGTNGTFPSSMGEVIGLNSNCFISSLTPSNDTTVSSYKGVNSAICYPISCNSGAKTYTVTVGSQTVTCPTTGGSVTVAGFDGAINCPDYNLLCTKSTSCSDAMDCATKGSTRLNAVYTYVPNNTQNLGGYSSQSANVPSTSGTTGGNTTNNGNTTTTASSTFINMSLVASLLFIISLF